VNQWLNPLKRGTGSNLVDLGRAAVRVDLGDRSATPMSAANVDQEAIGEGLRRTRGRLQGKSWAPSPPTGTW
jgi:hypothetical protein